MRTSIHLRAKQWLASLALTMLAGSSAFAVPCTAYQASPPANGAHDQSVWHIDMGAFHRSEFGAKFVDSLLNLPVIAQQLENLPASLQFIREMQFHSITFQTSGDGAQGPSDVLLQAHVDFDSQQLVEILRHGRQYTEVSFQDTTIHHWRADLDSMSTQVLRQMVEHPKTSSESEVSYDPVYLAIPAPNQLLVSDSLQRLTETLSQLRREESPAETISKRMAAQSITPFLLVESKLGTAGLTSLFYEESGYYHSHTTIDRKTPEFRQTADMLYGWLSDPEKLAHLFTSLSQIEKSKKSSAAQHDKNSLSLGFSFKLDNLNSTQDAAYTQNLQTLLQDSIRMHNTEDQLVIDAKFLSGPWDLAFDQNDGQMQLNVNFDLYSSQVVKEESMRQRADTAQGGQSRRKR